MNLDEALDSLTSRGPVSGEGWKSWREVRASAVLLLEAMPLEALAQVAERLRTICVTAGPDRQALLATAVPLIRLARGSASQVAALLSSTQWRAVAVEALALADRHEDCWPLLEELAVSTLRHPEALDVLSKALGANAEAAPARFAGLAARQPELAAQVAKNLALWSGGDLSPFGATLVTLCCDGSGTTKEHALTALAVSSWKHRLGGPAASCARLEAQLPSAPPKDATLLARVVALEYLRANTVGVEALLRSPRAEVRLGVVEALAQLTHKDESQECWSRLLGAGADEAALVRQEVFRRARALLPKRGLDAADARALVAALAGPAGEDAAVFLAFAFRLHPEVVLGAVADAPACAFTTKLRGTLEAPGTRACARCGGLPRRARWDDASSEPAGFSTLLERVPGGTAEEATLLRCPSCQAHFLHDSSSEHDVNSRRDVWWYERLTLRDLRQRFSARVDLEHPRVQSWERDLRADLEHVDPAIRAEANWELDQSRR